jgi:hypothetical protein
MSLSTHVSLYDASILARCRLWHTRILLGRGRVAIRQARSDRDPRTDAFYCFEGDGRRFSAAELVFRVCRVAQDAVLKG